MKRGMELGGHAMHEPPACAGAGRAAHGGFMTMIEGFKRRLIVCLILTVPIIVLVKNDPRDTVGVVALSKKTYSKMLLRMPRRDFTSPAHSGRRT